MKSKDIRDAFFDQVYAIAEDDRNVIFLTADMDAWSLLKFRTSMPDRFISVGIAEQNMISVASGLTLVGKKVFAYTIAPFISQRCNEQVKLDLCSARAPVVLIGSGPGLSYGADGPSHHSIDDVASLKAFPNISIYNICDQVQAKNIASIVYDDSSGPSYVRLEKGSYDAVYEDSDDYSIGMKLFDNNGEVLIISSGIMVHNSLKAISLLGKNKIRVSLLDLFRVKPLNVKRIVEILKTFKMVITAEENMLIGGIGSSVAEIIADYSINIPLKRIGLPNEYSEYYGSREWYHEKYRLTAYDLAETVTDFYETNNKKDKG